MEDKNQKEISHIVIFSITPETLDTSYKEFFEFLCGQMITKDEKYLYCLDCTRCDVSHPIYLDVTAVIQTTGEQLNFFFPHSVVLAIRKVQKGEKGIGFLRS